MFQSELAIVKVGETLKITEGDLTITFERIGVNEYISISYICDAELGRIRGDFLQMIYNYNQLVKLNDYFTK